MTIHLATDKNYPGTKYPQPACNAKIGLMIPDTTKNPDEVTCKRCLKA